jgi:hypothetical protein
VDSDTEPVTEIDGVLQEEADTDEDTEKDSVGDLDTSGERDGVAEGEDAAEADAEPLSAAVREAVGEGDAPEEALWDAVTVMVDVIVGEPVASPVGLVDAVTHEDGVAVSDTVGDVDSVAECEARPLPVAAAMVRLDVNEPDAEVAREGETVSVPVMVPQREAAPLGESASGEDVVDAESWELALKDEDTVSVHDAEPEGGAVPVRRTVPVTLRLRDCDWDTELVTEGVSQLDTTPEGVAVGDDVTVHESVGAGDADEVSDTVTEGDPVPEPPPSAGPPAECVALVEGVELFEPSNEGEGYCEPLTEGDAELVAVFVAVGLANRVLVAVTVTVTMFVTETVCDSEMLDEIEPEGDRVRVTTPVTDSVGEVVAEAELVGELEAVEEGEPDVVPDSTLERENRGDDVELCEKLSVGDNERVSVKEPVSVPDAEAVGRGVPVEEPLGVPVATPVRL